MNSKNLYDNHYFANRHLNDLNRMESFKQEKDFLYKYINSGNVCDIGCSTGEFLSYINWPGKKYGMEVNKKAINVAQKSGINFKKNILNQNQYFDLIIFRGTIQHLPNPFFYIEKSYNSLKENGYIVFLATPNSGSINYRIFQDLPMLDKEKNFYIPSEKTLCNTLKNFGFTVISVDKPYLKSPYANIFSDHFKFFLNLLLRCNFKHAFWGNTLNIIAKKNQNKI